MKPEDKFEVDRPEYEVGKVHTQFFLPATYPVTVISALATGEIAKLRLQLNPKLPYHKIYLPVIPDALTNLWGNIVLLHNNTEIFKVPWFGVAASTGRFSISTVNVFGSAVSAQEEMHFNNTSSIYNATRVFAIADEAKVIVEESAGVGSYTIGFAIQSSVANF